MQLQQHHKWSVLYININISYINQVDASLYFTDSKYNEHKRKANGYRKSSDAALLFIPHCSISVS